MRYSRLLPLAALAACMAAPTPMTAPAPTQLASSLTPAAVVQTAVRELATRGFTVTTSDATNGILVAQRTVPEGTAKDWFACRWPENAMGWRAASGMLTITIAATPTTGGSAVVINGATRSITQVGPYRLDSADNPDCVSNGKTETAIATAITTGAK